MAAPFWGTLTEQTYKNIVNISTRLASFLIRVNLNIPVNYLNPAPNIFLSKFRKPSHSHPTQFSHLNCVKPFPTLKACFRHFVSSKKLFSFSRYSHSCISVFPSFFPYQPLFSRMIEDKS